MGDVAFEGQDRIQSNDGSTQIGITQRQLKLTKPDVAAADATDADLILNDQQNVFKIVGSGDGTISGPDASLSVLWLHTEDVIPHGLDHVPAIWAFVSGTSGFLPTRLRVMPSPVFLQVAKDFPTEAYVESSVDETNVYIRYYGCPGGDWTAQPVSYKYYLLQETAD